MSGRLEGKVAFITGIGSSGPGWGTGKAIAVMFAKEGAKVFGFDKSEAAATETKALIVEAGGECTVFTGDVTSSEDVQQAIKTCADQFGRIDILVNNIGLAELGGVVDQSEAMWDKVFDVNLKSAFYTCKHCIPLMIESGGGAIVNISSIASVRWAGAPLFAYASSKAALNQLTKYIAMQHARQKIRANTIVPGLLNTPIIVEPYRKLYGDDLSGFLAVRDRICPGGKMGDAHDIAYAAVYLASDESKFVSGIDLMVDGGLSCQTPSLAPQ